MIGIHVNAPSQPVPGPVGRVPRGLAVTVAAIIEIVFTDRLLTEQERT